MKLRSVFSGILITVLISVLVILAISLLSSFTALSGGAAGVCVYAGLALAILLGAFRTARTCGGRVLLNTMAVSIFSIVLIMCLSLLLNGHINFNLHFLAVVLGSLFAGFLGAVLGK